MFWCTCMGVSMCVFFSTRCKSVRFSPSDSQLNYWGCVSKILQELTWNNYWKEYVWWLLPNFGLVNNRTAKHPITNIWHMTSEILMAWVQHLQKRVFAWLTNYEHRKTSIKCIKKRRNPVSFYITVLEDLLGVTLRFKNKTKWNTLSNFKKKKKGLFLKQQIKHLREFNSPLANWYYDVYLIYQHGSCSITLIQICFFSFVTSRL